MRLIDADELKEKAKLRGLAARDGKISFRKCITLEDIDNAPTVEVKPVAEEKPKPVHARWYQHCFEIYCSNCGEEAPRVYINKYTVEYRYPNRCPICNAIMDGAN